MTLQTQQPASHKKPGSTLALIFFIMVMDVMGITILSPVAPQIVLRYSDQAVMVTMITIVYAGGQFLASPLFGRLGDRFGRRPVLLFSLLGQALGYFTFGIGGSLGMLFLGRLIGGITAGNLATANAYIADISKPAERARNFALVSTAWSVGLILGPAMGGIFGEVSLEMPAFVAGGLALMNVLLGIFLLPESLPAGKRDTSRLRLRDINPITAIFFMAKKPGLGLLFLVYALFIFAFNGVNSTSALFVIQKFSAVTWQVSLMMILGGVSIALSNTFLVPPVVRKVGERTSTIASLLGLGLFYLGMFFSPLLAAIYPLNMLASCMNTFIFPAITTLSTDCVSSQEVGTMMGVSSAVASLMNIFGPLFAGVVYDHVMMGAPYWTGALVLVVAAAMMTRAAARSRAVHPAAAGE